MALDLLRKPVFDPSREIPSLNGKIILVTGGTAGLGRETAVSFAKHNPSHIYFTGRSQPSADETIRQATAASPDTNVTFIKCDLASFSSIQTAATALLSRTSRLDIVMANAGIMAAPPGLTADGYELQFGTNHVGHALLVKLLTPTLLATAALGHDVRIVWDTSLAHKAVSGIDLAKVKTPQADIVPYYGLQSVLGPWVRYAQSKLANLAYARAYAKRYPSITSVSIHPGISATGLVGGLTWAQRVIVYATSYPLMIPAEMCAWNQQWAATAALGEGERDVVSGEFYMPVGKKGTTTKAGSDVDLETGLWEWTQRELEGWEV